MLNLYKLIVIGFMAFNIYIMNTSISSGMELPSEENSVTDSIVDKLFTIAPNMTQLRPLDFYKVELKYEMRLNLASLKLPTFPEDILALKELKCLDLSYNQIAILPLSFGSLTCLEELNLSDNPRLPSCLAKYFQDNELKDLLACFNLPKKLALTIEVMKDTNLDIISLMVSTLCNVHSKDMIILAAVWDMHFPKIGSNDIS